MGHTLERALEVWIVVVGLVATGLTSGAVRWAGFGGTARPCVRTSGVVGVVGVVPYVFGAALSSCVSRKIGMPGKVGHCLPSRADCDKAGACPGGEIG
jgi:hypothetical protein